MRKKVTLLLFSAFALLTQIGCEPGIQKDIPTDASESTNYDYSVSVSAYTNTNAPALQSFVHATMGTKVLLFAGRTNTVDSLVGGMHDMNGNYAQSSFIPKSYNTNIYVYDLSDQSVSSLSYATLLDSLVSYYCKAIVSDSSSSNNDNNQCEQYLAENLGTIFKATNPICTQDGDTLYVLGGYGAVPNDPSAYYVTYNQVARIRISKMIQLVEQGASSFTTQSDWEGLLQLGQDPSYTVVSTGAEMFKIGDSIYLAGGHNFGNNQKYLDAVYPFAVAEGNEAYQLTVSVGKAISDMANPKAEDADDKSNFRRRDGPVVPALSKDPSTGKITESFAFYGGVFQPGDHPLRAWNDAIYVHPLWSDTARYTFDNAVNQNNRSVYACGDFVAFDSSKSEVYSFLLGGIGTGKSAVPSRLSGFTNNGLKITYSVDNQTSSIDTLMNVFPGGDTLIYGAESTLILDENIALYKTDAGNETEVIDLSQAFGSSDSIHVGYVYGGIEAFRPNPGTFGVVNDTLASGKIVKKKMSAASNKVWKVSLKRTAIQ